MSLSLLDCLWRHISFWYSYFISLSDPHCFCEETGCWVDKRKKCLNPGMGTLYKCFTQNIFFTSKLCWRTRQFMWNECVESSHSVRQMTPCGVKANTLGRTSGVPRAEAWSLPVPCHLARMDDGFFATHVQSGGRQQRSAFCKVSFSFAHKDILCVCKAYTKVENDFVLAKQTVNTFAMKQALHFDAKL